MTIAVLPTVFVSWRDDQKVRAIDVGDAWWQDVDNDAMLARAEEELSARAGDSRFARER